MRLRSHSEVFKTEFQSQKQNLIPIEKSPNQDMKNPLIILLFAVLWFAGCSNNEVEPQPEEPQPTLSVSTSSLSFDAAGGIAELTISSNTTWRINFESNAWCKPSIQTANGNTTVKFTAEANSVEAIRNLSYTITATGATGITLQFTQAAKVVTPPDPATADHIDPDKTGMTNDAKVLAAKIFMGWNIGNTLEATGGETAWGNPKVTNDLIKAAKAAGINAVRIPCAWNQYLEDQTTYKIKTSWLARVKEVVDYCVANDMITILNIHWDGGWMENNCTPDKQEAVNKKLAVIWKQIAIYFRNYDEHLLFAGANEPNAETQEKYNVLKVYMQTFVDVVRATGGRNAYRNLIIQAPNTDIDNADKFMVMPTDVVANRLMAEVHYYSPWQFCGMEKDETWGKMYYFWGAAYHIEGATGRYPDWNCEEDYVKSQFQKMKTKLVDKGIPIILGEFAAVHRNLEGNALWQQKHNESHAYFYEYVVQQAKNYGLAPFLWDTGSGIISRQSNSVINPMDYNALMKGANAGKYPF